MWNKESGKRLHLVYEIYFRLLLYLRGKERKETPKIISAHSKSPMVGIHNFKERIPQYSTFAPYTRKTSFIGSVNTPRRVLPQIQVYFLKLKYSYQILKKFFFFFFLTSPYL